MNQQLTYKQAEQILLNALRFGIDPSLEPIKALCEVMGNPQAQYKCIQIAGTNGKTSTTRIIAALLRACGMRVGLYVSPHLVKYSERIEIDGAVVSDEQFARAIEAACDAANQTCVDATEFELLTSAALWLFAQEKVDWAVLECGLGGRWDATSVVNPQIAVITGIGLDHTAILGGTLEEIAAEKAAIIKPNSVAVLASDVAAHEIIEAQAARVGARLVRAQQAVDASVIEAAHLPSYQAQNAATALVAVTEALGRTPTDDEVGRALSKLVIPGRFEVLRAHPLVIIDAAHNPQSARTLAGELSLRFEVMPTLLLGVLADKDVRGIVRELCPLFNRVVVTASSSSRAIPAHELARIVEEETAIVPEVTNNIEEAHKLLSDNSIIATGSITVAGEVKDFWC